jgi:hypothetical protein
LVNLSGDALDEHAIGEAELSRADQEGTGANDRGVRPDGRNHVVLWLS